MPFIKQERRTLAAKKQLPDVEPGDLCYYYYKEMVDAFRKEPRWITVHKIYKAHLHGLHKTHMADVQCDDCLAAQLAWMVFFQKYVMPLENQKEAENGTI